MKVKKLLCIMMAALLLSACGTKGDVDASQGDAKNEAVEENNEQAGPKSAIDMREQGNPTTINLSDIVEKDLTAWIKVSTAFDPTLSVYCSDLIPYGTQAFVVTFKISNADFEPQNMYWCYQFITPEGTVSLWNNTSAADQITVDGDGTYRMVFDVQKALGTSIDTVESLQIVLPGLAETTTTVVEFTEAFVLTDASEISMFTSGKVE